MPSHLRLPLALLIVAALLSGCGNSPSSPAGSGMTSDESEVTVATSEDPAIVEDGVSDDQGTMSLDESNGLLAAIQPKTFWRVIRERNRRFEIAFSDSDSTGRPTRAIVTVHTHLVGTFNIAVGVPGTDSSGLDSTTHVIRKPLDEVRLRRVLVVRVSDRPRVRARWRVAAVSGVEVSSRNHTTDIASLRVQSGGLDTTITNPLGFVRLRNVLKLSADAQVTLTVTTGRADDVVLLHHALRRFRLHNNGDNTYTGVFRAGLFARGLHHFGVDAISNGTLFDDEAAYDSQRWVFPYVVAPEQIDAPDPGEVAQL